MTYSFGERFMFATGYLTDTARKIEGFRHLAVGWHYGSGGPISPAVISAVQDLYDFILQIGLTKTDAFAGAYGEVLLTAYHEQHYVAIIVDPKDRISVSHESADVEVLSAEGLDIKEAKRHLLMIAEDIWNLSGSSTQSILTETAGDSTTWLLRIRPEEAECRSSSGRVLRMLAA